MRKITDLTGRLGNQMFQFAFMYTMAREQVIPDVYVQSHLYFEKYTDEVRALYMDGNVQEPLPYVSIHVRRGDYVGNPFYVDLFADGYYERAMAQFPDAKFMVFSDDIQWCKKQKLFKGCKFSDGDELTDLNKMTACQGHIVANSSFSWWAAWLSQHKTVAPLRWFTDGIERVGLPANWIRV